MSGTFDDTNRQAIPRWLDYAAACSLGLLRSMREQEDVQRREGQTSRVGLEWLGSPSLAIAIDLVAEALILKNFESEEAIKAANYVIDEAPSSYILVRELANHFLEPASGYTNLSLVANIDVDRARVACLKKSTRTNPFNPIAWSDLSLCYATFGQIEKARLAMKVALALGKSNRFILRSAARCFVHLDEPDHAVTILRESGLCPIDPWIASAEIAISEDVGFSSKCINKAKNLVRDDNFSHFSRSELTVELGTMEMKNGSIKRAKTLMRQALRDPSENALAQAEWMATQLRIDIGQMGDKVPASYEAQYRHLYRDKRFADSLTAAEMWGRFQPLCDRAFIQSSFIATLFLNDMPRAIHIVESAPATHRNNPILINNYAFALAQLGDIEKATQAIQKVNLHDLSDRDKFTLSATLGFISFRTSDVEQGRKLYSGAVQGFQRIRDSLSAVIAAYFWAIEEKRIGSPSAASLISDVKMRVKRFDVFELEDLVKVL